MKKVFLKSMLLLCALIVGSNAWADDYAVAYTFTITKPSSGAVSDYTKTGDMEIDGITWTVPGNWYANGELRIGGKSITNAKRTITGKGTISNAITKITVNHNGVSSTNLVVNSVTLTVASNSSFTQNVITKTVTPTISKNTAGNFELTPDIPCPANRYYKIEFDITNSNSSNYAFTLSSIVFYRSTVPHTLSSSVSPNSDAGSVTLSNSSLIYGATATATAVASPGYRFTGWSISNATVSSTSTNPTTVTMGDVDATITANFETATTYAVKWNVNGVDVQTDNVEENTAITFPTSISGVPGGYKFKGWSAETIDGSLDSYSSYVTSANATANITYYAVMAVESRVPASIAKMKKGDTFSSGDKIVVAAIDEDNSFGMYQQTQSSSYVKNYSFSEDAEEIASDDKNWWTVTSSSTSWILGDATDGYLYSSSKTNLSVDAENQTAFVFEDCNNGKFKLSYTNGGTKRYLCCRTDLASDKKNLFRLSGSDGINELTLYKFTPASVSYSSYCTTAPAYTLIPTPDMYYTTFYDESSNVSLPDGVTAYWGEYDEGELTLKAFSGANADVVPAGHAVILKASSAASFTVTTTAATAFDMTGIENDLIGSTGTAANANTYVLAYQGSPAATGFFKMTSGTIPAHKAYLDLTSGGGAPSAIRVVEENNNATSIEDIEEAEKAVKFFENGQIYILRDGITYDVMGRIVK
jgi:uncharacterized repeat protein (TIGR02543 family)